MNGFPLMIVIDECALSQLSYSDAAKYIFSGGEFSINSLSLKAIRIESTLYILNKNSSEASKLVIIDAECCNLFEFDGDGFAMFDRMLTLALSKLTDDVSVSPKWGPYSDGGRRGSIFANTAAKGVAHRIFYEERCDETSNLYIFKVIDEEIAFSAVEPDFGKLRKAVSLYIDALLQYQERVESKSVGENVVEVDPLGTDLSHGWSLDEWLETYLTSEQKDFVERGFEKSVRLRGAAGTGKTLALTVKFLSDLRNFEYKGMNVRVCFVTHSQVTKDLVRSIIGQLDPEWRMLNGSFATGQVRTVFELCNDLMNSREHSVSPVDIDAYEGRIMQKELIQSIVMESRNTLAKQFGESCSIGFLNRLTGGSADVESFVHEVFSEFSSIFDAEGIRPGNSKGKTYLERPQKEWLLEPREVGDRMVLLELYRRYRDGLGQMGVISVDQMVADAIGFLDSNTWEQLVKVMGYDALFIDETHLFSSLERQSLRPLMRESEYRTISKPMFVAYDLKQVVRDGLENIVPSVRSTAAWIGKAGPDSDGVTLDKVFRFTPQIGAVVSDLAMTFVDTDVLDEVDRSVGNSEEVDGEVPSLEVFDNDEALYKSIFNRAIKMVRGDVGGKDVCLICLDDEIFGKYKIAGHYRDRVVVIEGREDLSKLRYAGKRVIFTTPDYVSGLQFKNVFVLHADVEFMDNVEIGPRGRRLNVRRLYLSATRASRELIFACSNQHGGASRIFDHAMRTGSILTQEQA